MVPKFCLGISCQQHGRLVGVGAGVGDGDQGMGRWEGSNKEAKCRRHFF